MPQHARRKRDNAAASPRKTKQTTTVPAPAGEPPQLEEQEEERKKSRLYLLLFVPILLLIVSDSLVTFLYVRALDPLYGSVPIDFYLDKVVWTATIIGAFGPVPPLWLSFAVFGGLVTSIPTSSYWVALYTGRIENPAIGATVTHLIVLFPVIYIGVSLVKRITAVFEAYTTENTTTRFTILPACATSLRIIGGVFIAIYAFSSAPTSITPFLRRQRNRDGPLSPVSSSWFLVILVLPALHWLSNPPLLPQPMTEPYTHPNFPLRILSSLPSVTGIVVVGESLPSDSWVPDMPEQYPTSLRYLRASHSILGGVWIGDKVSTRANSTPVLDATGTPLGDSIYSAFVLQEAVHLIDMTNRAVQSGQEKALFIGLGTGIAATSFARQNIDVTVIEIDPAVYNASRHDRVYLEDARVVVAEKRRLALQNGISNADKYDYVVHDCFSGGGVPAHLFTLEFWEDLKTIMNPEGVVAVNVAGRINSDPTKAILFTLQRSFGQCRVLHDLPGNQPEVNKFVNLVFFCSPSTKPLSFRSPVETDYAGSHLRARIFDTLWEHTKDGEKWVLNDTSNRLVDWQKSEALEHWRVMRSIFPEALWATY
ncbi:hypothetical protein BJV77DRAFT_975493 [Russula vinacea]|nr:hypothetical protein BJV77DRAFT_975493 [Russula vinacea]